MDTELMTLLEGNLGAGKAREARTPPGTGRPGRVEARGAVIAGRATPVCCTYGIWGDQHIFPDRGNVANSGGWGQTAGGR